jgi:hypothetical protein
VTNGTGAYIDGANAGTSGIDALNEAAGSAAGKATNTIDISNSSYGGDKGSNGIFGSQSGIYAKNESDGVAGSTNVINVINTGSVYGGTSSGDYNHGLALYNSNTEIGGSASNSVMIDNSGHIESVSDSAADNYGSAIHVDNNNG